MLNLITDLAIAEASNVANIAYLTNIMDGVDGSSVFGYTIEEDVVEIEDKQTLFTSFQHTLDIRVLDVDADTTKLKGFVDNQTEVLISGMTPNGFMIWNRPVKLAVNRQFNNIVALAVKASIKTVQNYHGTAPEVNKGVYAGGNALALYDVLRGSNTRINGFTGNIKTGTTLSTNVSDGVRTQSIENVSIQDDVAFADLFIPFPGKQVSFSANTETNGNVASIQVSARAANGTIVGAASVGSISQPAGISTISLTLPSGTFYVRCAIGSGSTATDIVSFSRPRLRTGTLTDFVL